jgi:hypothetical protein
VWNPLAPGLGDCSTSACFRCGLLSQTGTLRLIITARSLSKKPQLPDSHNQVRTGFLGCARRTPQDSASMHSALGARNVLFLAPLHSLQLRCVLRRRLRYARHLPKHRRLRMSLRRVTTLQPRCFHVPVGDIYDIMGVYVKKMDFMPLSAVTLHKI